MDCPTKRRHSWWSGKPFPRFIALNTRSPKTRGRVRDSTLDYQIQSISQGKAALKEWLVKPVDTDQWMLVLLATGTGRTVEEGSYSLDVTIARHVKPTVEYMHVKSIH